MSISNNRKGAKVDHSMQYYEEKKPIKPIEYNAKCFRTIKLRLLTIVHFLYNNNNQALNNDSRQREREREA